MKKITHGIFAMGLTLASMQASAFMMDTVTLEMMPGQETVAQHITNVDASNHLMLVKVERITDPFSMKTSTEGDVGDVLYSPSRSLVGSKKDLAVNFYYHGPKDDKERYYRIVWTDEALANSNDAAAKGKAAEVSSRTVLSTVLVVHPRQENFAYEVQGNEIINKGNTSFRYVAYGACASKTAGKDVCREDRYIMPGAKRGFEVVNMQAESAKLGIWRGKEYVVGK